MPVRATKFLPNLPPFQSLEQFNDAWQKWMTQLQQAVNSNGPLQWIPLPLQSGWAGPAIAGFSSAYYAFDWGRSIVHLRGLITNATNPAPPTIGQVAANAKPLANQLFPAISFNGSTAFQTGYVEITQSGVVQCSGVYNSWLSLDGIFYHLD